MPKSARSHNAAAISTVTDGLPPVNDQMAAL